MSRAVREVFETTAAQTVPHLRSAGYSFERTHVWDDLAQRVEAHIQRHGGELDDLAFPVDLPGMILTHYDERETLEERQSSLVREYELEPEHPQAAAAKEVIEALKQKGSP